ncbi:MAG TPA: hypothetical protein VJV96_04825 [Candidatus Angelobacter sp.]|jgi:hypothetical protein|nr:hypothetical protein [Candidatus Angelobacter sp.]
MRNSYAIAVAALFLVVGAALLAAHLIAAPARAAAANLAAINDITVGQTTEADLLRRPQFQELERNCFGAECMYGMMAENKFLNRLHLAPRTSLWTMVTVRDGIVIKVSVICWRVGSPGVSLSQVMGVKDCDHSPCIKDLITPNRAFQSTRITFDSRSEIRNHMPEAVNSACLSRLHGCQMNTELMPILREIKVAAVTR